MRCGNHRRFAVCVWTLGSVLLLGLAGCGGIKTYPVEGKITYPGGTPMPGGGQIVFDPVDASNKNGARGIVQVDGTFKMSTFDEGDGVPEGKYRIAIVPTPLRNPNQPPPGWPPLATKYVKHETSGLQFDVIRGKNECNLVVEKE